MHDPDGLEIVLLWIGEKVPATIVIRLRLVSPAG
jgi:hypothetical protein